MLQAGSRALLLELETLEAVMRLFERMSGGRPPGVGDIVPAARTVLVEFEPAIIAGPELARWVRACAREAASGLPASDRVQRDAAPRVEIAVRYRGEDLDEVAQMLGLTPAQLVERHTGCDYQAAFAGFAPGFVYLTNGDPSLRGIPRRAVPRTRVPAGSVAVAGDLSAVYPSDSPGGWRLLGVTSQRMWDLARPSPALVQPGFRVRFRDLARPRRHYSVPAGPPPGPSTATPAPAAQASGETEVWMQVLEPGLQTLVQDGGRPGATALGVSRSGVLDRGAAAAANGLVGNPADAAVLENAWGGLCLVCHGRAVVAVTGAPVGVVLTTASGMRVPAAAGARVAMEDGQMLRLTRPRAGMRCYVAVRGGWDVPPVLGSRAADVLSGIGPAALRKGDHLPVGAASGPDLPAPPARAAGTSVAAGAAAVAGRAADGRPALPRPGDTVLVDVIPGPRGDWFEAGALDLLQRQPWEVTAQSNRVGLRLAGEQPLVRAHAGELASEGMVAGALEVPAGGQPILFLADHPLTGGYPVIAVVTDDCLDRLAQVPPGAYLRFKAVREAQAS